MKTWQGTNPERCDLCNCKITNVFVDGKTSFVPWAIMCMSCHNGKYGLGIAQKYVFNAVLNVWEKVLG